MYRERERERQGREKYALKQYYSLQYPCCSPTNSKLSTQLLVYSISQIRSISNEQLSCAFLGPHRQKDYLFKKSLGAFQQIFYTHSPCKINIAATCVLPHLTLLTMLHKHIFDLLRELKMCRRGWDFWLGMSDLCSQQHRINQVVRTNCRPTLFKLPILFCQELMLL